MGASRHRLLQAALSAVLLASCAPAWRPLAEAAQVADPLAMAPEIGVKRWVSSRGLYLCAGPPDPGEATTLGKTPCLPTAPGRAFTVEATTKGRIVDGYLVRFDDGKSGWVSGSDYRVYSDTEAMHREQINAKATCDRKGGVRVGMTRDQVYASCWGKPTRINKTIGPYGVHEQLIYGGSNYLYMENGVLRTIQTSER
jgi:hypothetical protein